MSLSSLLTPYCTASQREAGPAPYPFSACLRPRCVARLPHDGMSLRRPLLPAKSAPIRAPFYTAAGLGCRMSLPRVAAAR